MSFGPLIAWQNLGRGAGRVRSALRCRRLGMGFHRRTCGSRALPVLRVREFIDERGMSRLVLANGLSRCLSIWRRLQCLLERRKRWASNGRFASDCAVIAGWGRGNIRRGGMTGGDASEWLLSCCLGNCSQAVRLRRLGLCGDWRFADCAGRIGCRRAYQDRRDCGCGRVCFRLGGRIDCDARLPSDRRQRQFRPGAVSIICFWVRPNKFGGASVFTRERFACSYIAGKA
jgi:hypothetical protein